MSLRILASGSLLRQAMRMAPQSSVARLIPRSTPGMASLSLFSHFPPRGLSFACCSELEVANTPLLLGTEVSLQNNLSFSTTHYSLDATAMLHIKPTGYRIVSRISNTFSSSALFFFLPMLHKQSCLPLDHTQLWPPTSSDPTSTPTLPCSSPLARRLLPRLLRKTRSLPASTRSPTSTPTPPRPSRPSSSTKPCQRSRPRYFPFCPPTRTCLSRQRLEQERLLLS